MATIQVTNGDSKQVEIYVESNDAAVDLTGAQYKYVLKKGGEAVVTKTGTISSGPVIDFTLRFEVDEMGTYSQHCKATDSNGNVSTIKIDRPVIVIVPSEVD